MAFRCALSCFLLVLAAWGASDESCSEGSCAADSDKFPALVDEGNELARSGNHDAAIQKFRVALGIDDTTKRAANPLTNIAICLRLLGRPDEALQYLQKGLAVDPASFYAHFTMGNWLQEAEAWGEADKHYKDALKLAPTGSEVSVRVNWANALQRSLHYDEDRALAGRDVVEEAYKIILPVFKLVKAGKIDLPTNVAGITSSVLYKKGKAKKQKELHRLAVKLGVWQDVSQRPKDFNWDFARRGLSTPWWTGETPDFLDDITEHWKKLQEEVGTMLAGGKLAALDGDERELYFSSKGHDWRGFYVVRAGKFDAKASQIAPVASSIFKHSSGIGDKHYYVSFSVMMPGTESEPHCGLSNERITCHLALQIPEASVGKVGISIAGEVREWKEGEWLCFDDSFEHKVWNNAAEPRAVIVVNIRHPRL